jgi:Phospholipase_D-nuclease N-terminal
MEPFGGGLIGLLVLAADVWAIVNVVQSGATTGGKVVWILLVLVLPVLGFIIWLVAGPRGGRGGAGV